MLPFLASPRRYIFSPPAQLELAYLRRQMTQRGRWLRILDGVFVLLCLWVATLPLQMYVTHQKRGWMLVMMFVISGLHLSVWLRTLLLAGNSITREKIHWDEFVLTGLDARQIILGKWWAIVRYTAASHFFVAILRLGLALAYAQYMHAGFAPLKCPFGGAAFCHVSWGYDYLTNGFSIQYQYSELQPQLWKIGLALGVLLVFALLEVALLAALGICTALFSSRHLRALVAILLRGILFIGAVLSIFATEINWRIVNSISEYDCSTYYYPGQFPFICPEWALILETTEIGLATLGDNGNFIAAMVMRPVGNDVFVLRNIAGSGTIGLTVYIFLIWLCLRVAQFWVVRQHALRPVDLPPAKSRQLRL